MGVLTLFKGGRDHARAPTLLVVGVHREERAFGEAVAAQLPAADFDLLRIEQGLSGRRPGPDGLDAYRRHHRALYEQILTHIKPTHRVVLDLHTGFDETGPCADVLCTDPQLLRCVEETPMTARRNKQPATGRVGGVQLVAAAAPATPAGTDLGTDQGTDRGQPAGTAPIDAPARRWPWLKPDIPCAVWRGHRHLYIGIEIYLPHAPNWTGMDVELGAAVTAAAADCGLQLAPTRQPSMQR